MELFLRAISARDGYAQCIQLVRLLRLRQIICALTYISVFRLHRWITGYGVDSDKTFRGSAHNTAARGARILLKFNDR